MNFTLKSYCQIFKLKSIAAKKKQIEILNKFRSRERSFNIINIKENIATKTVRDVQKGKNELFFYKNNSLKLQSYYPEIISSEIKKNSVTYDMELITALDLSVFFVQRMLNVNAFRSVLKKIDSYFLSLPVLTVTKRSWRSRTKTLIVSKLNLRWSDYKLNPKYKKINLDFKKKYKISLNEFKSQVEERLVQFISQSDQTKLTLCHGDLCFSNILLLFNKQIKFVDPRGARFKNDLFITPYYDFAKLSQCVHGNYDGILSGCSVDFRLQADYFDVWVLNKKLDLQFVRLIESSLFLSLLPLHMDRVDLHLKFIDSAVNAYRASL